MKTTIILEHRIRVENPPKTNNKVKVESKMKCHFNLYCSLQRQAGPISFLSASFAFIIHYEGDEGGR